jgi:hypothetical protein
MTRKSKLEKAMDFGYRVGKLDIDRSTTLDFLRMTVWSNLSDKETIFKLARDLEEEYQVEAQKILELANGEYAGTEVSKIAIANATRYSAEIKGWAEHYLGKNK